jgi:hypothetical protein
VDVIDNLISGVAPFLADSDGDGITSQSNREGSIVGNRISAIAFTGSGTATGINNTDSVGAVIARNNLIGLVGAGSVGIFCSTGQATAHANVVQGFNQAIRFCFATSNTVGN